MSELASLETVIARRADLMTSDLSETELVMLNIERGAYYGMADTAKAIWNHIDAPRSVSDVCARLRTQFAVDRETCERETLAFVNEMLKYDLVRIEPTSAIKTE